MHIHYCRLSEVFKKLVVQLIKRELQNMFKKKNNNETIEYLELEWSHKDHWVQLFCCEKTYIKNLSHCCNNLPLCSELGDLQVVSSSGSFGSRSARELCAMLRSRGERIPQNKLQSWNSCLCPSVPSQWRNVCLLLFLFSLLLSFLISHIKKATGTFCKHQRRAAIEPRVCSYWERYAAYKGTSSQVGFVKLGKAMSSLQRWTKIIPEAGRRNWKRKWG